MKSFPLSYFIQVLNDKTPKETSVVNYVSECISLGKDACYRRLRGEVEFTIGEIIKIVSGLAISIDDLIGLSSERGSVFQNQFILNSDVLKDYESILHRVINYFEGLNHCEEAKISFVLPTLPPIIIGYKKMLHKCKFYKWYYDQNPTNIEKLSNFTVPQTTFDLIEKIFEFCSNYQLEFIFDKFLILDFVDFIKFLYSSDKITKEEIAEAKAELSTVISRLEEYAITGVNHKNKPIAIYVSHILLQTPSIFVANECKSKVIYSLYSDNTIVANDTKNHTIHKKWLSYIKRSCSLISLTGEIERIRFFNTLREALDELPQ